MTTYQRIAKQAGDIIAEQAGKAAFQEGLARARNAEIPTSCISQESTTVSVVAVSRHIHAPISS